MMECPKCKSTNTKETSASTWRCSFCFNEWNPEKSFRRYEHLAEHYEIPAKITTQECNAPPAREDGVPPETATVPPETATVQVGTFSTMFPSGIEPVPHDTSLPCQLPEKPLKDGMLATLHDIELQVPVEWDRVVEAGSGELVQVYGWIPRLDGTRDFVLIDFAGKTCGFVTSSAKHSLQIARALGVEEDHNDCIPFDVYFKEVLP